MGQSVAERSRLYRERHPERKRAQRRAWKRRWIIRRRLSRLPIWMTGPRDVESSSTAVVRRGRLKPRGAGPQAVMRKGKRRCER